jgi:hypothetical protein
MENEHVALARRFRDFALDHLPATYLHEPGRVGAPGRLDLRDGLREAYSLRSRYVHNLRDLPHFLDADLSYSETIHHDHRILLTVEGLSRVARAVICEFVTSQPKVEREDYNYHLERYGIIQAQLAPEYWVGKPEVLTADKGRQWLEAFLQQFGSHLLSKSPITELSAVLLKIEKLLPSLGVEQKTPLAAVYCLWNNLVPEESRSASYRETINQHRDVLAAASVESLAVHLLLDKEPAWDLTEHQATVDRYFAQRNQKSGFRAPALFEAGFVLALAERFRRAGANDSAAELLGFAADNFLAFPALRTLAGEFQPDAAIDWDVLVPRPPQDPAAPEPLAQVNQGQADDDNEAPPAA